MTGCLVPTCSTPAVEHVAIDLCAQHVAVVVESSAVEDVLPHPCLACGSRLGVRHPSGWVCAVCEWVHGVVPDGELPPPRLDVVYYLRFDDRIKIGTTSNLRQRLGAIWHQELVTIERGDRTVERRRHEQFADARIARTEWFRETPALAAHVETVAGGVDPWTLHARWRSELLALRG